MPRPKRDSSQKTKVFAELPNELHKKMKVLAIQSDKKISEFASDILAKYLETLKPYNYAEHTNY